MALEHESTSHEAFGKDIYITQPRLHLLKTKTTKKTAVALLGMMRQPLQPVARVLGNDH